MRISKTKIQLLGRLKKRSDFLHVQKVSKQENSKWVAKSMVVELAPNDMAAVRYGLTVSKRVSKLAVTRNRIKRRLRAAVCEVLPDYADQGCGIDVVVIGRAATLDYEYEALKQDLVWCLKRLGVAPSTKGKQ